ncbi:hypothetical protein SAMN04488071_1151 [Kordiimonas lacus]|uniref:DUF1778 domain-containing protein n=2 Tax=Kordiimonas lacus TaxID=637679 RepID=A0A1G6WN99_9PROT|nr:hypothetical protein SAMN04488071_1151 [Kordiimonas lacus]
MLSAVPEDTYMRDVNILSLNLEQNGRQEVMELGAADRKVFVEALIDPPPIASENLKRVVASYKRQQPKQ